VGGDIAAGRRIAAHGDGAAGEEKVDHSERKA
jgi:hypothetical protein